MPLSTSQNVGFISAANAGANKVTDFVNLAPGATFSSASLEVPSLNHHAWIVTQTAGVDALSCQPQAAFRRGGNNALEWRNVAPPFLVAPGTTSTFTLNVLTAQAIRLLVTHTGAGGQPVAAGEVTLSGSA